ncbi:ENTH/VHS family protein [Striga asiatica]|uniref:ENTH/VHS family protein n=1 Tax=Striga asiatica TaxID=4170 RepID=A0A5A7QK72_STRAF|nr:ENTH/VHS family protein [Striga asiatica]
METKDLGFGVGKHELSISFRVGLRSGPLFKFRYRSNEPCRPFDMSLKTGTGIFDSVTVKFGSVSGGSPKSMGSMYLAVEAETMRRETEMATTVLSIWFSLSLESLDC